MFLEVEESMVGEGTHGMDEEDAVRASAMGKTGRPTTHSTRG